MDKKFCIFDMDGTLVDSMVFWRKLAREFLDKKEIFHVDPQVFIDIQALTVSQAAAYFLEIFPLQQSAAEMADEMYGMMEDHYRYDIPLKAGVSEYLHGLKEAGVRLCVASATALYLVESCLRRLEVLDCFDFLLSCETTGVGKEQPDIYLEAAERFGALPQDVAVFEDAHHAAKTAKEAGFYLVAVYDESEAKHWDYLQDLADISFDQYPLA